MPQNKHMVLNTGIWQDSHNLQPVLGAVRKEGTQAWRDASRA